MKSVVTPILFFLTLAIGHVIAIPQDRARSGRPDNAHGPSKGEICGTVYGPRRTLVGRKTTTRISTVRSTTTILVTKSFTTTPPLITTSLTSTAVSTSVITLSQPTNTISTTITESSTVYVTHTSTQRTTSVITNSFTTVSTSTVPTLPGFTPIASSLTELAPEPIPKRKRQSSQRGRQDGGIGGNKWESDGKWERVQHDRDHSLPGYPQKVQCTVIISKTIVVSKTSTRLQTFTASRPFISVTETTTSVSISAFNPAPASVIITSTLTTTLSSTLSTTMILTELTTVRLSFLHCLRP